MGQFSKVFRKSPGFEEARRNSFISSCVHIPSICNSWFQNPFTVWLLELETSKKAVYGLFGRHAFSVRGKRAEIYHVVI